MRVAIVLTVAAALAVALAVTSGDLKVAIFLVFPILHGSGPLAFVAVALLFSAAVAWMYRFARPGAPTETATSGAEPVSKSSGVLLIGPVPIIWGSDPRSALVLVGLTIVLMVLALGFLLR
ncbi:MAG: TIGR00304 family membrane protein [Methanobacteriota archaeon]